MANPSGELVYRVFETDEGPLELLAEAILEDDGKALHLKDAAIYPREKSELRLGIRRLRALLQNQIVQEARTWGVERLRVSESGTAAEGLAGSPRFR